MALGEDGVTEFTIDDEVKIAKGKYQGAYGILRSVSPDGLCVIQRGEIEYMNVSIKDLATN